MRNKDGIYTDISDDEYFGNTERVNASTLKKLLKSEKHLNLEETFAGARFGNVAHKWLLEPNTFNKDCVLIAPKTKTETSKEFRGLIDEHKGKYCYTESEMNIIKNWKSPIDFSKTQNELVLYATCPYTGLKLKGKIDSLDETSMILQDVKTTSDITKFENDAFNNGGVFSLCYYNYLYTILKGESLEIFRFIAFETKAPYNVSIFNVDMGDVEVYMNVIKKTLTDYKRILDTGVKKNYISNNIKLNGWQSKKLKCYLEK